MLGAHVNTKHEGRMVEARDGQKTRRMERRRRMKKKLRWSMMSMGAWCIVRAGLARPQLTHWLVFIIRPA